MLQSYVVRCATWYHLYNLKNMKNTHEGVLILVKLQDSPIWYYLHNFKNVKNTHGGVLILVKLQALATLFHGYFSHFLNCTNGTKSRNTSHIATSQLIYRAN